MESLDNLNPAQREAVETAAGPLLILAGPGSGKTRVLTTRVAYLIAQCGIRPRSIMAVTFTNKAAREMVSRLTEMLGPDASRLSVGTFHSICARILRRDAKLLGIEPDFTIYDDDDQMALVKRTLQDLEMDPKTYPPRTMLSAIDRAKSQLISPEAFESSSQGFDKIVSRVYMRYQSLLTQNKALDFDDLLMKTYELFRLHPEALAKYQDRYVHILVDEFQDTNTAQYGIVRQLAAMRRNICVVGDPDQSIYSWRHADIRNILDFRKDYPDAKVVFLEQNYRSTRKILAGAHSIISASRERIDKGLWTENEEGPPIRVVRALDEMEEAQLVAREVQDLVLSGKARYQDCAVMYRTNAQSRAIEEVFIRYGLPYQLVGSVRFYERREVKDMLAYLRLVRNPYDSLSLARIINVPARGIGQKTVEALTDIARDSGRPTLSVLKQVARGEDSLHHFAQRTVKALQGFDEMLDTLIQGGQTMTATELLDAIIAKTGYEEYLNDMDDGAERWENLLELRGMADAYQSLGPQQSLTAFLEGVSLFSDTDEIVEKEAVTLITLHQAKGLEFPVVFLVGVEEGILPHFRSMQDRDELEEERRLLYVGMTRAKAHLYLLRALRRRLMGQTSANPASRFLADLPVKVVQSTDMVEDIAKPSPAPGPPLSMVDLEPGDHVLHERFGPGIVMSCTPASGDQVVVVAFAKAGTKRLLGSLAHLKRVDESDLPDSIYGE